MKNKLLLVFALAALAFTGCRKEEQPEPISKIDQRILGEWLLKQIDHPDGSTSVAMVTWIFNENNTIDTYDTTYNYTAKNYQLIINENDTFNYSFPVGELNAFDKHGNNFRFRR